MIVVAIPILTENLLAHFDLVYVWFVLASLSFFTIIAGATFKPRLIQNEEKNVDNESGSCDMLKNYIGLDIIKNTEFVLWSFASFIGIFGNLVPIITMV